MKDLILTTDMFIQAAIVTAKVHGFRDGEWKPIHDNICAGPGRGSAELEIDPEQAKHFGIKERTVQVRWMVSAGRVVMTMAIGDAWFSVISSQEDAKTLGIQGACCTIEQVTTMFSTCRKRAEAIVAAAAVLDREVGFGF